MQEKTKFLIQYYLIYFLKNFLFLKAYIILLLTENLNVKQIGAILSIYSIASLFIQIPNGVLSDKIGYKKSIISVILLLIIGYLTILFNRNFWSFCLFYTCFGLYETIFGTAKESLFYNNIKHLNLIKNFSKYKNISRIIAFVALILASFISGKLILNNVTLVFKIDILVLLINILIIAWTKEYRNESMKVLNKNYFKSMKNGFHYIWRHKSLLKLILFRMFWFPLSTVFISFCPLIYKEISPVISPRFAINIMVSAQIITIAILQSIFFNKFTKKNIYLQHSLFITGAIFALLSFYFYSGFSGYLFNVLYLFFTQFAEVLTTTVFFDLIPTKSKACIMSIASFLSSIFKFIILNALGLISKSHSYRIAFAIIFSFYLVYCIIIFITILSDKHLEKIQYRYV